MVSVRIEDGKGSSVVSFGEPKVEEPEQQSSPHLASLQAPLPRLKVWPGTEFSSDQPETCIESTYEPPSPCPRPSETQTSSCPTAKLGHPLTHLVLPGRYRRGPLCILSSYRARARVRAAVPLGHASVVAVGAVVGCRGRWCALRLAVDARRPAFALLLTALDARTVARGPLGCRKRS